MTVSILTDLREPIALKLCDFIFRLTEAYQSYLFALRAERETNRMMQSKIIIKTEEIIKIEDDSDESENEDPVQSSDTRVQSTTGYWNENDASDSGKSVNASIEHESEQRVTQSGLASPTPTLLITTKTVPAIQPIQSHTSFDGLQFQCNYCSITYDDVDGIYKHWIHKDQHANAFKAFRFHIEMNGACYNCSESGTFNKLKQHFKDDHPGLQFGAVDVADQTKCLICCFSGKNMAEHFRTQHAMTMEMDSPIRMPAHILNALKALRVQKKFKCNDCDNVIYNTKNEIIEHYRHSMHDIRRSPFIEIVDEQPTVAICGICRKSCDETQILDHIQNHQIQCSNCATFDGKINELASHYRQRHPGLSMDNEKLKFGTTYFQTKLVHCNGLTFTYANVLGAKDDENEKIQTFFAVTSSQCTQSILKSPPHKPNNHDPAVLECSSSVASMDDSDIISPRSAGSKSDPNELFREDLLRQRSYLDTLVILGLPAAYMSNDKHLLTMFSSLCLHLQVSMEKHEIKSIYSMQKELIVKLSSRAKKEKIIQTMASTYCWPRELKSDTIVKMPPNEEPQTIYVNPKLTSRFHRMWMKARGYRKQKKIHSYRLSSGGIAIRITKGAEEIFARSFEDIDNCVNGTSQPIKRKNINLSTMSNPKRMKSN